jgi:hypothetical protein
MSPLPSGALKEWKNHYFVVQRYHKNSYAEDIQIDE